jgi:hypothetical protein
MVQITTIDIHPKDLTYISDIIISSKYHGYVPIFIYNYYSSEHHSLHDSINHNYLNIQLSQERKVVEPEKFELTLGHCQTLSNKKQIWFPYILYRDPVNYLYRNRLNNNPSKFCCFIVFNHRSDMRNKFFDYVNDNYKKVESLGKHKRNVSEEEASYIEKYNIHDHRYLEVLSKYKFMICFENESEPFYLTEKLGNAYISGCIPIYWGMKNVENFLNSKAFIHVKDYNDFPNVLNTIKEIDTNDDLYNQIRSQPLFKNDKIPDIFTKDYYVNKLNECFKNLH